MAIKPKDNEAFYREVDEELRKEQLSGFWKRYGIALIAGVILLLAAIAGTIWWQNEKERRAGENAEALTQIFDDIQAGRGQGAAPKLDALAKDGSPGYRAAAMMTKADLAIQEGREAEAIATFGRIAGDEDLPQPYRDAALIRQTGLEFDKLPPATVVERLRPLAQPGNPWFGTAGELVAAAHLKAGQPQEAAPVFAAIAKDKSVPESIRSRAVQMASALGVDALEDASAPAGATKEATE